MGIPTHVTPEGRYIYGCGTVPDFDRLPPQGSVQFVDTMSTRRTVALHCVRVNVGCVLAAVSFGT